MPEAEQLQRSVFKWVQAKDDEDRGREKPVKAHATITAAEVARKYGVPEEKLRNYIKTEIEEEASCKMLPFTVMMFMSYTAVVGWHDPVLPINDCEDSVAFDIEENANFAFTHANVGHKGIFDINSYVDFWSWMLQGVVPLVFVQEKPFSEGAVDYPEEELSAVEETYARHKRGYMLNYNKIIGGLRIRQERGKEQTCGSLEILIPFYNQRCMGPLQGSGYELYPEKTDAMETTDPKREFWLWVHEDVDVIIDILKQKEKEGWLDRATEKIEIAVPVYNGNLGVYSIVYVDLFFSRGGHIWKRVLPLSTYSQWWHSWTNAVPDVLWILGLLSILVTELMSVCLTLTAKQGGGVRGLYHEYLSFWNIVDWATVVGGFWIICGFILRFMATAEVNKQLQVLSDYDEETQQAAFRVQSEVFFDILAKEVLAANDFRLVLGFYPLLIVMRLFEAFAHQPRLAIVTSTLGDATVDLTHFLLVFLSIFITYAVAGVVLFGREVDSFTNTSRAFNTCFRIMMGDFDWDEMLLVGRFEAGFWFSSFTVIIVLLMLNMLLAIVMDAYSAQKSLMGEAETLTEEFMQIYGRWKGERSGELRSLKEVSRAVRSIKDGQTYVRVSGAKGSGEFGSEGSNVLSPKYGSEGSTSKAKFGFKMSKSSSSIFPHKEEFALVTVKSLLDACPKMHEEQAIELITKAVNDFYLLESKGDANLEEMCQIIRKVNFSTKRLKRHMKNSLVEFEIEKENERLAQEKAERIREGMATDQEREELEQMCDDGEGKSFAEMLNKCRANLGLAQDYIGEEELRDVDISKARYPAEFKPLQSFDDAVQFTCKRVLDNEAAVLAACRSAGIDSKNDMLRRKALGKVVRILKADPTDKTIKVRAPRIGDLWFGLGALCQLRPIQAEDEKKKKDGQGDSGDSDAGVSVSSEAGHRNEEVLKRIYELETEKRIGQQTVTEAINAVSELKWQQVKEKTERSKLHQKILGLRKKLVSRAREHRRLAQEATRQEERLKVLTQSRDEYTELVQSLLAEQKKLNEKLGNAAPLALEDQPYHHGGEHDAGRDRDLARARERDLALQAIRHEKEHLPALPDVDRSSHDGRRDERRGRHRSGSGDRSANNSHASASDRSQERRGHQNDRRHRDREPARDHRHAHKR